MANAEKLYHNGILAARKVYAKLLHPSLPLLERENDPDAVARLIADGIRSERPFMVSRFGAVEITCVANYLGVTAQSRNAWKVITGRQPEWWWNEGNRYCMRNNAGFFSNDDAGLARFGRLMLQDMREIDVLLSWQPMEWHFREQLAKARPVGFIYVDPFWSAVPWTKALEGKRVLVVHPFAEEIMHQYTHHRTVLHRNPDILPEFDLRVVKAVQSIGGNDQFATWFDALDHMKQQIDAADYDVCLLGCGAYGMPLAAHVKRSGRQAIHFGGSLQLLFGIKGRRWETADYGHDFFSDGVGRYPSLINEHWIRPFASSHFAAADKVENGCYW